MTFTFRKRTSDKDIYTSVVVLNEYCLPKTLNSTDVVVDIGSHIGTFTYACLNRGSKQIYSYEAFKDNYDMLIQNLRDEIKNGFVKPNFLAVWRSDLEQQVLFISGSSENFGGRGIDYNGSNNPVNSISLDNIINNIINHVDRIKLLKLDCEGSEFAILLTSKKLHFIDYICCECHNKTNVPIYYNINEKTIFDKNDILLCLNNNGFDTIVTKANYPQSLIFAKRRGFKDFFNIKEIQLRNNRS